MPYAAAAAAAQLIGEKQNRKPNINESAWNTKNSIHHTYTHLPLTLLSGKIQKQNYNQILSPYYCCVDTQRVSTGERKRAIDNEKGKQFMLPPKKQKKIPRE